MAFRIAGNDILDKCRMGVFFTVKFYKVRIFNMLFKEIEMIVKDSIHRLEIEDRQNCHVLSDENTQAKIKQQSSDKISMDKVLGGYETDQRHVQMIKAIYLLHDSVIKIGKLLESKHPASS